MSDNNSIANRFLGAVFVGMAKSYLTSVRAVAEEKSGVAKPPHIAILNALTTTDPEYKVVFNDYATALKSKTTPAATLKKLETELATGIILALS